MHGKFLFDTLRLEVLNKIIASELATSIRMQDMNLCRQLGGAKGLELLESHGYVRFVMQEIEASDPRHIICETDIVAFSRFRSYR
jgi:hypothetical protein